MNNYGIIVNNIGMREAITWLQRNVLESKRFESELADAFPPSDIDKLRAAARSGEATLESAWLRPKSAKKVTSKKKAEIHALLGSIVTRESASDALYTTCFPERVLLEQFSRSQQLEARLADKDPVSKRTPGRSSKH